MRYTPFILTAGIFALTFQLHLISERLKKMSLNDAQLTNDVTTLTAALADFKAAIASKLDDLGTQIATLKASADTDDPAQDAAITALEATIADIKAQTAALAPNVEPTPADGTIPQPTA